MCYMDRVGVRELRQNLSVYLRRVVAGETLEVTDRGQPVALLAPLGGRDDPFTRLAAAGRLRPPEGAPRDLGAPLKGAPSLSAALAEERAERRP
jgi:prevent-host-death family protein